MLMMTFSFIGVPLVSQTLLLIRTGNRCKIPQEGSLDCVPLEGRVRLCLDKSWLCCVFYMRKGREKGKTKKKDIALGIM